MDHEHHIMMVIGRLMGEARELVVTEGQDGLRPSQLRVIGSVPPDGGITVTELAERVGMTKQGIGQFVTQLSRDGYLATASDPHDGRARIVRRTPLGQAASDRLSLLLDRLEADWARRVGEQRYREFRSVLDELTRTD